MEPSQDLTNSILTSDHTPSTVNQTETTAAAAAASVPKRGKKVVGFSRGTDTVDTQNRPRSFLLESPASNKQQLTAFSDGHTSHSREPSFQEDARSHLPELDPEVADELRRVLSNSPRPQELPVRPRPAIRRESSSPGGLYLSPGLSPDGARTPQELGAIQAYERGKRLERRQAIESAPTSRQASPSRAEPGPSTTTHTGDSHVRLHSHPETDSEDEEELEVARLAESPHREAQRLVRNQTLKGRPRQQPLTFPTPASSTTPPFEEHYGYEYDTSKPDKMRGGILGMLLSLQDAAHRNSSRSRPSSGMSSLRSTPAHSPTSSGASTPVNNQKRPWTLDTRNASTSSLAKLVGSSSLGAAPVTGLGAQVAQRLKEKQTEAKAAKKRNSSSTALSALGRLGGSSRSNEKYRITVHIAETIARQRYLERLCRALMEYGAPTHRLEEYMKMSARVLEIEAQFLYIPGSMIISFDDSQTHTAAVRLVRVSQGLDLGKLRDVHELYKDVVHDRIGVEEATRRLTEITKRKPKFNRWLLVLVYGLASASVGPFAFGARLIDLPIAFLLGMLVGLLQLQIATRSDLYSNVFEITAAVLTSFLARAFGSINGGNTFCFSALAQSSIALILPGYTVLCASLELQSRSIVAGSVRMVYAIIYSLFLGFGIMLGSLLFGMVDRNATSATTCQNSISSPLFFPAVPIFTLCLIVINQGKWKQVPVMMIISCAGYLVNFYTAKRFSNGTSQISNTLGAFAIGVMANLYSRLGKRAENWWLDVWEDRLVPLGERIALALPSRLQCTLVPNGGRAAKEKADDDDAVETGFARRDGRDETQQQLRKHRRRSRNVGYGLAAAAMLPAIFVQVPSGLAVSGSLVSGLATANSINAQSTSGAADSSSSADSLLGQNSFAFSVSYAVVQVAIGISCGLFLAAVVVYPAGKRRSGLFSF